MKEVTVSAVVVTYNKKDLLKKCLEKLQSQTFQLNHIIVVDNNSSDGTTELLGNLAKNNSCILDVSLDSNVGGAGGFNIGLKKFISVGDDYVVILDDDSLLDDDCIERFVDVVQQHTKFGFLCSNVRWKDGTACLMNVPKVSEGKWSDYLDDGLIKVDTCSFVSVFISRDVVQKVGYPITKFFIWGDDLEYTGRINREFKKLDNYLVAKSHVLHYMNNNINVDIISDSDDRLSRYYYRYRNLHYVNRKYGVKSEVKYITRSIFTIFKILRSSSHHKLKRCGILLKGIIRGIWFNPEVEQDNMI